MIDSTLGRWALTFGLTVAIELAITLPLLRHQQKETSTRKHVALILLANLATHPLVFALATAISYAAPHRGLVAIPLLEVGAMLVEGVLYARLFARRPWPFAIGVSAMANAASLGASVALWMLALRA